MKKVFIGHRGVGKTQLLKRHATYFPKIRHFDLDEEIEKQINCGLTEYFQQFGEAGFRKLEAQIFEKLVCENSEYIVSLGAGFDVSGISNGIEIIFVSRVTDQDGRIFLNRPRLDVALSPLDEYKNRFNARNSGFLKYAGRIYHLPEGLDFENETEKTILTDRFLIRDAYYTLSYQDLNRIDILVGNYKNIELRTDLLDRRTIEDLLVRFPDHNWLVSIRTSEKISYKNAKNTDVDFNCYLEGCQILSSHADQIKIGINQLAVKQTQKLHLKLCPLVKNLDELSIGHEWQQQDPDNRSFLPRSINGKWLWYRQLAKYQQKFNFIRNFADIPDQPSLSEWLTLPDLKPEFWSAVLGQPVHFSRSPVEHQKYFSKRNSFFTKIELSSEEFENKLKFLIQLGLKYAAVTSPLKECAFKISHFKTQIAEELKSANTLFIDDQKVHSHNTDVAGFKELVKNFRATDKVAIWGGGGTLKMMKSVLPEATLYSSQSGRMRDETMPQPSSFDYLIWAAPGSTQPQDILEIKAVIDLNYTENSTGLEFAARRKISYTSGIEMFKLQALKQQEFWSLNERK